MAIEKEITRLPTGDDTELARQATRVLARHAKEQLTVRLPDDTELVLPRSVTDLLAHLLTEMARGNAVTIIPIHAELTTQEAANHLNVSRPHLVQLLEGGAIEFHMVGTHRRIRFEDLLAFKEKQATKSREAREALTKQAQELGFGY